MILILFGRLCYALAFGVYVSSSYLKDLVCSPRPYAPLVVRLTVGNHHLEYGLPQPTLRIPPLWRCSLVHMSTTVIGSLGHRFRNSSDWSAPLVVTVVCLLLVNQHPSPVDDCPSFEDAIPFASVILGIITSFWCSKCVPALNTDPFTSVTPGVALDSPAAITTWVLFALLKLVTGVLIIFSWRILAKPSVQTLLPPLFRWLAWVSPVRLPHRRHYTPATEYVHDPLRAVPNMIDLDFAVAEVADEDAGVASGRRGRSGGAVKWRGSPSGSVQENVITFEEVSEGGTGEDGEVKHYDADVLTKVLVYVGIGAIATVMVPALFEALEWGVPDGVRAPSTPKRRCIRKGVFVRGSPGPEP
ncbi:hypothetical protein EDB89DRAFT_2063156 [Lactarius sanguifluus]|nr:hypothetical protein EDB89DRAFT_2063156 [Lactarius sanguifluus]